MHFGRNIIFNLFLWILSKTILIFISNYSAGLNLNTPSTLRLVCSFGVHRRDELPISHLPMYKRGFSSPNHH